MLCPADWISQSVCCPNRCAYNALLRASNNARIRKMSFSHWSPALAARHASLRARARSVLVGSGGAAHGSVQKESMRIVFLVKKLVEFSLLFKLPAREWEPEPVVLVHDTRP